MPKVVSAKPQVIPYPRIESSPSSSKSLTGTLLFADNFDVLQVFEAAFLYTLNKNAFLIGSLIGAIKPLSDYHFKNVITKKSDYEVNQEQFGQLIIVDQEMDEYNDHYKDKKDHKKAGNDFSGVSTYTISRMMVLGTAYFTTQNFYPIGCLITGALGIRFGFNTAQRLVQTFGTPSKK